MTGYYRQSHERWKIESRDRVDADPASMEDISTSGQRKLHHSGLVNA